MRAARSSGRFSTVRESEGFHKFMERGLWPLMGTLVALATTRLEACDAKEHVERVKAQTEGKVVEAKAKADTARVTDYNDLARKWNVTATALQAELADVRATQKAQSALLAARERDFVVEGRPAPRRVDAGIVKIVRDNAAKSAADVARAKHAAPAIAPIPLKPPPPPPPPPAPAAPQAQAVTPAPTAPAPIVTPPIVIPAPAVRDASTKKEQPEGHGQ